MQGSKNMAFDSANLTTPDIKWLGVRPSDLDKFQIPEQCRLEMSAKDIETGQHMLSEEFIQQNPEWVKEVQVMLESKTKASDKTAGGRLDLMQNLVQKIRSLRWVVEH